MSASEADKMLKEVNRMTAGANYGVRDQNDVHNLVAVCFSSRFLGLVSTLPVWPVKVSSQMASLDENDYATIQKITALFVADVNIALRNDMDILLWNIIKEMIDREKDDAKTKVR